jgi:benzoyl-CoA reductase/2-hydroxyglutaryl-CoA dehydratase subunit BcrC/BadD/HgdB
MKEKIGFTTTIPVEVIFASGNTPVDLNNIFITDKERMSLVREAEVKGFPRNMCGWIKGLYAVVKKHGIKRVIAVTQGDCSNTHALMEILQMEGVTIIPFAYPYNRDRDLLRLQIDKLREELGVSGKEVAKWKNELDRIRTKTHEIDEKTWKENTVSGFENHLYLVSTSDMNGDPEKFENDLDAFLSSLKERKPFQEKVRLGFIGVPPIFSDLYEFIEEKGGRVVFNEVQRQFSMPGRTGDIVEQYRNYTYPYDVFTRIDDIREEMAKRKIDGLIHYIQAFCYRQLEDLILRSKENSLPILTLEGDNPTVLDERSKIRIEGFIEMLKRG